MAFHTLPRLYVPELSSAGAAEGLALEMMPGQARYLGNVLRRETGAEVRLFSADAGEWLARIESVRKDKGMFSLVRKLRDAEREDGPVLVFALLKRDATDLVVRMGTELGVSRFVPVIADRSIAHRVNKDRLEAIAVEAAEQSERMTVPLVEDPTHLTELLGTWSGSARLYAAIERSGPETGGCPAGIRPGDALLTGPEGGFSNAELDVLRSRPFVTPISLGRTVLRAETAAVAGLAQMTAHA